MKTAFISIKTISSIWKKFLNFFKKLFLRKKTISNQNSNTDTQVKPAIIISDFLLGINQRTEQSYTGDKVPNKNNDIFNNVPENLYDTLTAEEKILYSKLTSRFRSFGTLDHEIIRVGSKNLSWSKLQILEKIEYDFSSKK